MSCKLKATLLSFLLKIFQEVTYKYILDYQKCDNISVDELKKKVSRKLDTKLRRKYWRWRKIWVKGMLCDLTNGTDCVKYLPTELSYYDLDESGNGVFNFRSSLQCSAKHKHVHLERYIVCHGLEKYLWNVSTLRRFTPLWHWTKGSIHTRKCFLCKVTVAYLWLVRVCLF